MTTLWPHFHLRLPEAEWQLRHAQRHEACYLSRRLKSFFLRLGQYSAARRDIALYSREFNLVPCSPDDSKSTYMRLHLRYQSEPS